MTHRIKKEGRLIFTLSFLTISSIIYSQTIQELEHELLWSYDSNKLELARQLLKIDPFNSDATEHLCRYYYDTKIDSVSIYFEHLIAKYPKRHEPYLLRAELLFLEIDYEKRDTYNKYKIKHLKNGLETDPNNASMVFKLAEVYYKDFIYPLEKEKDFGFGLEFKESKQSLKRKEMKKSTFDNSAKIALNYFYELWKLDQGLEENIYYAIRQLECYLNCQSESQIPEDFERNFNQCFFPYSYLVNLEEEWECDFSIDYLFEIDSARRDSEWLENQLVNLKEGCLYNKNILPDSKIYRFTWLRSFDHPIAIRIEKMDTQITLYWKVGKGAGGYAPEGLKKSGKKRLSLQNWHEFERLIEQSSYDVLPNEQYIPMNDGASWTLEKKESKSYKVHNTNWPSKEIRKACMYLLDLTRIKIKDDDKY